ncbi:Predicted secreted Zn-dependent protease [Rhizobium multihospitium]|uniref:Predicted secreted Zn-dependent protease n=2 Tax=Rhizobium multihospitium TaxID=410764 RepID=A0A1C3WUA8_9HYPH|nr:Predicted secreted Zn-dependent protease [Rhizobium multihospitium]
MPQGSQKFNMVATRMPLASHKFSLSCALLLAFCIPGLANAEVIARKSISYFDIKGSTADELDAALNQRGPLAMGSSSHHPGATKIRFGGNATYSEANGRCYISGVKVTVDTEIILPRWRDRRHASKQLSTIWDTLAADIRRHEDRHVEIARQHARQMERQILSLPSASNCDALQEKANEVTSRETDRHDADQARFDRIEAINFTSRIQRLLYYRSRQGARQ